MRRIGSLLPLALLAGACATTPDESEALRAQNALLKAEIEIIKRNCSYYREVEIKAEEGKGEGQDKGQDKP